MPETSFLVSGAYFSIPPRGQNHATAGEEEHTSVNASLTRLS